MSDDQISIRVSGPTASGKTAILATIVRELRKVGVPVTVEGIDERLERFEELIAEEHIAHNVLVEKGNQGLTIILNEINIARPAVPGTRRDHIVPV